MFGFDGSRDALENERKGSVLRPCARDCLRVCGDGALIGTVQNGDVQIQLRIFQRHGVNRNAVGVLIDAVESCVQAAISSLSEVEDKAKFGSRGAQRALPSRLSRLALG